jgi:hypothetical protein
MDRPPSSPSYFRGNRGGRPEVERVADEALEASLPAPKAACRHITRLTGGQPVGASLQPPGLPPVCGTLQAKAFRSRCGPLEQPSSPATRRSASRFLVAPPGGCCSTIAGGTVLARRRQRKSLVVLLGDERNERGRRTGTVAIASERRGRHGLPGKSRRGPRGRHVGSQPQRRTPWRFAWREAGVSRCCASCCAS